MAEDISSFQDELWMNVCVTGRDKDKERELMSQPMCGRFL